MCARTYGDAENSCPHDFSPIVNILVWASFLPEDVETLPDISVSIYLSTVVITNYLALGVHASSLTRWTEDDQSSLVGSVEN